MFVNESYSPVTVGVNATVLHTGNRVAGFLALTSGTVTIKDYAGTTVINALPVTAGVFHAIPFRINAEPKPGGSVVTAGGASGYLAVL